MSRKQKIVNNLKGVVLLVCEEAGVVTIEPFVEKPAEEMDAELGN